MSSLPEVVSFSRRTFAKVFSALSVSAYLNELQSHAAPVACVKDVLSNKEGAIGFPREQLFFWVNGGRLFSRSHLAVFLNFKQSPQRYLEKVLLTNDAAKVLGARFFYPTEPIANTCPPYLIFNHLDLRYIKRCFLVFQVRENDLVKVYRYTLDAKDLEASTLSGQHLPFEMQNDFAKTHGGKVFGSFRFPAKMAEKDYCAGVKLSESGCFLEHFPKPRFKKIALGNVFTCELDYGFADIDPERYFRYFVLTDPVGRLLGLAKRSYLEEATKSRVTLVGLADEFWLKRWGVPSQDLADLSACPYVLAFAEHVKEGLFCSHVWLR